MSRTLTETVALFEQDVGDTYPMTRIVQKALLNLGSPSKDQTLSSTKCITVFHKSELRAIFYDEITTRDFANSEDLSSYSWVQDILATFQAYQNHLRGAVSEAKSFLPKETIRVLEEYCSPESMLNQLNVAIFIILAVNMQES